MANTTPINQNIGATTTKPGRIGDSIMGQLGELLTHALRNAASLEVRTYTNESADTALATEGDPLVEGTRLRAFTRISMDGDTQQCIPLRASGETDDALWALHNAAVDQARRDRAASVEAAIAVLKELSGR